MAASVGASMAWPSDRLIRRWPQQTTRAMINSFVLCLLIDVAVTVPLYL